MTAVRLHPGVTAASKGGKIIGNRFSQQADAENTLYVSSVAKINRADYLILQKMSTCSHFPVMLIIYTL